jgi:hypothetical protein
MGTTIKAFCAKHRIRCESSMVDSNPNMDDWRGASHYRVTLRAHGRQMSTFFSMGAAHCHEPEAVDVLDCLLSDASSIDNCSGFDDWAAECGMDTDSRKAERTYNTVMAQTAKLKTFLGELYDAAIGCERL